MAKRLKNLERIVRGVSNRRRIEILHVLEFPELDLIGNSRASGTNFKTCHDHARPLATAVLVYKRPQTLRRAPSALGMGKNSLMFLRTLEGWRFPSGPRVCFVTRRFVRL
jgi:hypothetical protein